MGSGYGPFVAAYTAVSLGGIVWRISDGIQQLGPVDGTKPLDPAEATRMLQSLLQSSFTMALLVNLLVNVFVLVSLCVKTIFFGTLTLLETQKVVERLINYVIFKVLFLTWVVQPETMHVALWIAWFAALGFLKMFQGLARDRLDRLNASPTATVLSHLRVFSVLLLVFLSDLFWIQLCLLVFKDTGVSTFLLLLFEPLSIACESLQAVVVHGIQLLDTWQRQTMDLSSSTDGPSERSAAGAAWEWRGMVVRNCSFFMDLVSLLLALGHCLHIWWLRGLAFQLVDAVLFLNLRALLSAILKRIKGYMRIQAAMSTLQGALPDASSKELLAYDDDCAICKEPMARAKRLPCAHLFHLSCLRSWLDQGIAETYSCPTCRRPLFMGPSRSSSEGQAGFLAYGVNRHDSFPHFSNDQQENASSWRGGPEWIRVQGGDAQPSEAGMTGDVGRLDRLVRYISGSGRQQHHQEQRNTDSNSRDLTRIELMMRQLSGGQPQRDHRHHHHQQQQPSSSSSGWWLFGSSRQHRTSEPNTARTNSATTNGPQVTAMVNMVREVLPHVADEVIVQDLRRTNCVIATVNNLL